MGTRTSGSEGGGEQTTARKRGMTARLRPYFSILARKALTPCHFADTDELAARVLGFQAEFAKTATPFDWTFTRADLHALLDRLDQRGRLTPAA